MTRRHSLIVAMIVVALVGALLVVNSQRDQTWREGSRHGPWRVVFDGYGSVRGPGDSPTLAPASARSADITHAALVVTDATYADFTATAKVLTQRQLRRGGPQAWEVGWFLWRYRDPNHFYAVALKPNGWEMSKQDPSYPGAQRFLASGQSPTFPVGATHSVSVTAVGPTITVAANGATLVSITDTERPYIDGALGLYTEDAEVTFSDVHLTTTTSPPEKIT